MGYKVMYYMSPPGFSFMISGILYVMTHKQLKIGFLKDYRMTGYTQ